MSLGASSTSRLTKRILSITATECLSRGPLRKWMVNVDEPGQASRHVELEDPNDSKSYTDHDSFLSSPEARTLSQCADDDTRQTRIQTYCGSIGRQLGLDELTDLQSSKGNLEIYVYENIHEDEHCSIHGLRWELLEHHTFTETCGYTIRVTRICNGSWSNDPSLQIGHQKIPTRVLLVVARSWQLAPPTIHPNDHYADLSPDLIYHTLRELARFRRQQGRPFTIHVVRSGGIDALKSHLQTAKLSRMPYDMIHFDLHGRINPTNNQPELLFGLPYRSSHLPGTGDDALDFSPSSFEFVSAKTLAGLLREHEVKLVALNSCQSAYAQNGPISNLCYTLLKHGEVNAVTAMASTVRGSTARLYYEAFYSSLVLAGQSFSSASAFGREYIRNNDEEPLGLPESEPSALPGAYRRARTGSDSLRSSPSNQKDIKSSSWVTLGVHIPDQFIKWRKRHSPSKSQEKFLNHLRSHPFKSSKMGIGQMVLEDQLVEHKNVFIQTDSSPMSPKQEEDLKDAVDDWKLTEFVDDVTIINSKHLTSPAWYYKECLRRIFSFFLFYHPWVTSCKQGPERTGKWDGKGPKTRASMIIFTDFDYLFEDQQREKLEMALARVSSLQKWLSKTQVVYLVFVGNADVPWESGDIHPDEHPWVQGPRLLARRDLGMVEGGRGA
ncbi:hypothetical protein BHE90_007971 [Fusarium euwallaceae]|uniref:CHAT domain-containing protein n=2 Tax=Fusarium solani species complex TaxID=232080 RepID=A0A430LPJ0_9HYPO|nr:hypothetical protein CDV31_009905 [Fusarium ambrosium]RTE77590.1 hypothetical protein BHE90_007971 [Fusarium euwallaceae]